MACPALPVSHSASSPQDLNSLPWSPTGLIYELQIIPAARLLFPDPPSARFRPSLSLMFLHIKSIQRSEMSDLRFWC